MFRLEENRSQTWFKVLNQEGSPIDYSGEYWKLPEGETKGYWLNTESAISKVKVQNGWKTHQIVDQGTWLISDPKIIYELNTWHRVFIAQLFQPPVYEEPGMIWVKELQLVREATHLDLRRYGIYRAIKQLI